VAPPRISVNDALDRLIAVAAIILTSPSSKLWRLRFLAFLLRHVEMTVTACPDARLAPFDIFIIVSALNFSDEACSPSSGTSAEATKPTSSTNRLQVLAVL
jgi:hypothetical protein